MDPPQPGRPLNRRRICHGHAPFLASSPAITREICTSGLPQEPTGLMLGSGGGAVVGCGGTVGPQSPQVCGHLF